ncbi:MAG: Uma2 family endonuclease [Vulcanimicrobiaceae bacterium]
MAVVTPLRIPETKPATELVDGRLHRKVSPKYRHARIQGEFYRHFFDWAKNRGRVGTEWRFAFAWPGQERQSLVPDFAYLSYARLPREQREAAEEPQVAPDVAVEIWSPSDRRKLVARKIELYLAAGCVLVLEIDPKRRSVSAHDRSGSRTYAEGDVFEHVALPGFRLDLRELFAALDD